VSVVLNSIVAAGVPALLAGLIWLVGGRVPLLTTYRWLLSPLAVGGGYLLAHILINGMPPFPPTDSAHWLFYFALVGILLGWLAELPASYRWFWGAVVLMLLLWMMVLAFKPLIESGYWMPVRGASILVILSVATWLLMVLTAPNGEAEEGAALPFLLATLGGLSAGLIFYNKSASLGQLSGSLGAVVGIGVPLGWLMRGFRLGRGAVSLTMMLMAMLWAMAYGYAELPAHYLALLYLAGLSLALRRWTPLVRLHPLARFSLSFLLLLLLVGIPLLLSFQASMKQNEYLY
jgi:hypothetical protein